MFTHAKIALPNKHAILFDTCKLYRCEFKYVKFIYVNLIFISHVKNTTYPQY